MDGEDDIGADIRAAMTELKGEATPAVETPAVEAAPEQIEQASEPTDDRLRDEHGRFKAKEAEASAQTASTPDPKPAAEQSAEAAVEGTKPLTPPRNWEPEAKAAFMAAPPAIQKQILAQEEAAAKGRADWEPKAQTMGQLEQVIAPVRQNWASRGLTEAQGVAILVDAQQKLDADPAQGLAEIAKGYGFTLSSLLDAWGVDLNALRGQPEDGQAQPAGQQIPPQLVEYINGLTAKVNALEGVHTKQQQTAEQQAQAEIQKEIDAFAADPKNIYFENVKPRMAALLSSKQAGSLADAYEQATWADPKIRALLVAEQAKAGQQQQAAKVAAAKKAGVSVTGDPGPGRASSQSLSNPPSNSRDDIAADVRAAFREVRASV